MFYFSPVYGFRALGSDRVDSTYETLSHDEFMVKRRAKSPTREGRSSPRDWDIGLHWVCSGLCSEDFRDIAYRHSSGHVERHSDDHVALR